MTAALSPAPATNNKFLAALAGRRQKTPPIWLMRQAGRYLPEYREIRAKAPSFVDFCYTPALAAEATLQPIRRFGFDAAILFSDILVLPDALGQMVSFEAGEGPKLEPIEDEAGFLSSKRRRHGSGSLRFSRRVERVRGALTSDTALIGFCGAPWTVASYMIAGQSVADQAPARLFAYRNRELFSRLVNRLADASADFLARQIEAGADAVQIFDSWAGVLPPEEFERWCVEPIERLVARLRSKAPKTPIIAFARCAAIHSAKVADVAGLAAIGLDTAVDPDVAARLRPHARSPGQPRSARLDRRRRGARRGCSARPFRLRWPRAHLQPRPRHSAGDADRPRRAPCRARARLTEELGDTSK